MKKGIEIERKFVIKLPEVSLMQQMPGYTESRITQTYLSSRYGETRRVRKREFSDRTDYIETVKIRIDNMSSTEIERNLTEEEYTSLLAEISDGTRPIIKVRHAFTYLGRSFEIDVYPEWTKTCIMENELPTRDTGIQYPPFISIVSEVTGNKAYSNASMSRSFPEELSV